MHVTEGHDLEAGARGIRKIGCHDGGASAQVVDQSASD
jgi:hypothetical protein